MPQHHATLSDTDIVEAYVYLLGRYLVIRQETIDLADPDVDYNVLKHNPPVLAGTSSQSAPTFVNPNLDVVYSEAWVAVDANTPAVLTIPEIPAGTYYTAQIVDEWAEITHNINERNYPHKPYGRYALCLQGSSPSYPDDCLRIDIPSSKAKLLTRVQLGTDPDLAISLQKAFSLSSLGRPQPTPIVEFPTFTNANLPGGEVFAEPTLAAALAAADACPRATELHPVIRAVASQISHDEHALPHVDAVIRQQAIPKFLQFVGSFGDITNGWSSTAAYPSFGADYWFRATANFGGIWWNSSTEAVYEMLHQDADGETPTGDHHYTLTFAAGATPDTVAAAFWSLTAYGKPDYMLVPNEHGRYTLGYQSALQTNDDGSTTVHFAAELPANTPQSNWLPTPPGKPFTADLRLYLPSPKIAAGQWAPPVLTKAT